MKTVIHKNLTTEIWQTYSYEKQILSIGAEFARAKSLSEKKNTDEVQRCIERAMELTDLTVYDPKWRKKLKELLRFREIMGELYLFCPLDTEFCESLYKVLLSWNGNTAKVEI